MFDLVKKPTYKKAWEGMFRHEKGVPVWLVRVEGPATPVEQVKANGVTYQHTSVCKAHDCASNMFHVIFSADGRKAWGLLLVNETNERFFGAPDARMQVLLRNVLQQ
ncbi:MAG: lysozyme inhibitor [Chlorobiaceae bacterium]|nr:lysozyme inhibitor [Chlorobiaceae bacterium]